MEKILAAFPKRPLHVATSGVPAASGQAFFALVLFALLIGGAIWVGPNLVRDFIIQTDAVEVPDADIRNAECSTYRGFLTDCGADIAYSIKGKDVSASLHYLFIDPSNNDYQVSVMRSASHPSLATLSLGLDMLWNRAIVAGAIGLALLLGGLAILRTAMRTRRFKQQLQDSVEMVPVPATVTASGKVMLGLMGTSYALQYNDGKKSQTTRTNFKGKDKPFLLGMSGKQPVVLGVMPKQGGLLIVLDEALTRADFTPAERMTLNQAVNATAD